MLHKYVIDCLELANQCGYASIAFPVLGTGNMGYPPDVVAQTMLGAVDQFLQTNPSTSLMEIKIVIFMTDKHVIKVSSYWIWRPKWALGKQLNHLLSWGKISACEKYVFISNQSVADTKPVGFTHELDILTL